MITSMWKPVTKTQKLLLNQGSESRYGTIIAIKTKLGYTTNLKQFQKLYGEIKYFVWKVESRTDDLILCKKGVQ